MVKQQLESLINSNDAKIGVIGLGYVGLPLIVEFGLKGFEGIGFEVDAKKADDINAGRSYIVDVSDENVKKCVDAGKLAALIEQVPWREVAVDHEARPAVQRDAGDACARPLQMPAQDADLLGARALVLAQ